MTKDQAALSMITSRDITKTECVRTYADILRCIGFTMLHIRKGIKHDSGTWP